MNSIKVEVEIDQEAIITALSEYVDVIQQTVRATLIREGFSDNRPVAITVLFTGDARLRQLNRDYAGEDYTTDVLSFVSETDDGFPIVADHESERHIGDIAISIPQTERQAQEKRVSFERELAMLAIHGTLHLLGYDHATPEEERVMFGKTDDVLAEFFA